ncbi:NVEALA domain-containing protein [Parabacteroides goldsteinii]|uniref:NVEALA domain-containing protein n=1 Tax=Parabacteroides goldsteinii TaxID=328812 RepID=UPI0026DAF3B5|nr:NVEALA domain-containing protein [Parabacteroides goldsteinii]
MKKKIFGAALIAAMAITAGWNFNQSKNETQLSDLTIANVEALARNEVENIKCNRDIDATCFLLNNLPVQGERY